MSRAVSITVTLIVLLTIGRIDTTSAESKTEGKKDFEPPKQPATKSESRPWQAQEKDTPTLEDLPGGLWLPEIAITPTPKPTADETKFDREYVIELEKFGISNRGTNPVETSRGLNDALRHAASIKANRIVFPEGTYLVSETDPIVLNLKNAIIDLNGSTLQINPNGLKKYSVVEIIPGAENLRLTNGQLRGDLDTHDFSESGVHAWGHGLTVHGGRNLEIDHLTISKMTGDGANTRFTGARNREELLAGIIHSTYARDLEPGGFSDAGEKIANPTTTRSIEPWNISDVGGEFEFGYSTGYHGFPFVRGRIYQAYFFDEAMTFLEKKRCLQFRKVAVPEKANFVHLEFNQPEVSDEPLHSGAGRGSFVGRISNFRGSVDVHFHHNQLVENQRLGLGYCGGRRWLIEENLFADNGGVAPSYGIDLEDGWEFMQDVVIRNNRFRGNHAGDLVICAGSELLVEGNHFENNVALHGRPHHYVFRNNHFTGGWVGYKTRTGVALIEGNRYENCSLSIVFDTAGVADGINRRSGQAVATAPIVLRNEVLRNVEKVSGTYFHLEDSTIEDTHFIVGKETASVSLKGNQIAESTMHFEPEGPGVIVHHEENEGAISETGPGLERRRP